MSKLWRILPLALVLAALYVTSAHVSFPASWPVHCLFTFTLTLLVYKNLLNCSHARLFLFAMILLMALWEVYEWAADIQMPESAFLRGLDIAMDLACGLLGTIVGIRKSWTPRIRQ